MTGTKVVPLPLARPDALTRLTAFEADPAVWWSVALVLVIGALLAGWLAWRARQARPTGGPEALVDRTAVVHLDAAGYGQVFVDGAWWAVRGHDHAPVADGQHVRVVGRDDLTLIVEPAGPSGGRPPAKEDQP